MDSDPSSQVLTKIYKKYSYKYDVVLKVCYSICVLLEFYEGLQSSMRIMDFQAQYDTPNPPEKTSSSLKHEIYVFIFQRPASPCKLPGRSLLARVSFPVRLPVPSGAGAVQGVRPARQRSERSPRRLGQCRLHILLHSARPLPLVRELFSFIIYFHSSISCYPLYVGCVTRYLSYAIFILIF